MPNEITTEDIPIKYWLDKLEGDVLEQAKNLANHPYAFHHIAIMPDAHVGYGMPIGGVLATKGVVIPNAVGVDIGCGMCAVETNINEPKPELLKQFMGQIRNTIPLGFEHNKEKQPEKYLPNPDPDFIVVNDEYNSALKQIGTLGGGNHFIDFLKDNDGYMWIMVHSGSRNLGYKVAKYYNDIANDLNSKQDKPVDPKTELCFLSVESEVGEMYLMEMQYCVDFAYSNRKLMMEKTKEVVQALTNEKVDFGEMINIAHNFASEEEHFGEKVWVHRKGATQAFIDQIGIVPGSQGHPSFIVKGKGNKDSFKSCSHGAGRQKGRKQAIRELDYEKEINELERRGIIHGIRNKKNLDEAPGAYKDIKEVMNNQKDLVEIIEELHPLAAVMAS